MGNSIIINIMKVRAGSANAEGSGGGAGGGGGGAGIDGRHPRPAMCGRGREGCE